MRQIPGQKLAVIGSGISGLAAAWLLATRHDVHLFEAGDYLGGHTHTVDVADNDGSPVAVDTGFIVFNPLNYPNLCGLFDTLGVASQASDMSFGVSLQQGEIEYGGGSLSQLFASRRSVTDRAHWSMLRDILRFNRAARRLLAGYSSTSETLAAFLDRERLGKAFRDRYLLPMTAAIWSSPMQQMLQFPAVSLVRFMDNHGLLDLVDRPGWRTVTGGSRRYVERMSDRLSQVHLNSPVVTVDRGPLGVTLCLADGSRFDCDQVVFASHADQTLRMLARPTIEEQQLLGAFAYEPNEAVLHSDRSLMPRSRRVWSSWNYVSSGSGSGDVDRKVSVTYWMNHLQRLDSSREFFVTLNPDQPVDPATVLGRYHYEHPLFDVEAMRAQRFLRRLQGAARSWFCGSYFGYGFHEDGLRSAVDVASAFGITAPWQQASADQSTPDDLAPHYAPGTA